MTWTALVGAAGAWIGTFACIPPTWRVVRRQSARDYSWWGAAGSMLAMTCTLIYLGSLGNWLAVTAQAACYVAYLVIVVVKWRTERACRTADPALIVAEAT
jgi:uncharacterized protein with PQ loop repeat